ncbi:hypothetical protein P691DRAFT_711143 [Macrolepiota fuliginosa MF-IS2]|uniref:Autophagy-related protein 27 n=1 Tax=Macrolepiota fuliginosa MF-IS2 TaxID=1400762 RepID=A0A9P6C0T0_9AGAR|nr:hypothetical protein P691DRAFT_711143 [Macrolepiota fuliginosa MF-IS2]
MTAECSFDYQHNYSNTTHSLTYNLCPLFLRYESFKHELDEDTPPTHTKYVYEIALGRGIEKDGTLPTDLQCPSTSLVCLTVINTRPNHPSEPARIIQVVSAASGDVHPKFRVTNTTNGVDHEENHLQLTVYGPQYMEQRQKAIFHMVCDKDSDEASNPKLEFLYRWNGTHVFKWKSNYACPVTTTLPDGTGEGPGDSGDEEGSLPPIDPEPDEHLPTPPTRTPLWLIGTIIFLFAMALRIILAKKYTRRLRTHVLGSLRRRSREDEHLLEDFNGKSLLNGLKGGVSTSSQSQRYTA